MNDGSIQKAEILIQQGRYPDAESFLRTVISGDPDNVEAMYLLAEATLHQDKNTEALNLINDAIRLNPGESEFFSLKSRILLHFGHFTEAEETITKSIELNPANAQSFAVWAFIKLSTDNFQDALTMANKALKRDPGNLLALNTRSSALLKLDKKQESFDTIRDALRENPNNSFTHANYGWGLLETGHYSKALEHFKEALHNDPGSQYAREGMKEALKAKYVLYMLFLKYSFWIRRLSKRKQWMFIIGCFLLALYLQRLSSGSEETNVFTVFYFVYFGFAFLTWTITPVSNLILRFHPYGKYLLNENAIMNSNFVCGSFIVCILSIALYLATNDHSFLMLAGFGFLMTIPFSVLFNESKNRYEIMTYVVALFIIGLTACASSFLFGEMFMGLNILFFIGLFLFQLRINDLTINKTSR